MVHYARPKKKMFDEFTALAALIRQRSCRIPKLASFAAKVISVDSQYSTLQPLPKCNTLYSVIFRHIVSSCILKDVFKLRLWICLKPGCKGNIIFLTHWLSQNHVLSPFSNQGAPLNHMTQSEMKILCNWTKTYSKILQGEYFHQDPHCLRQYQNANGLIK